MTETEQHSADKDVCSDCGGREWSTASDGLGGVASVAATCLACGYVTTSTVSLAAPPSVGDRTRWFMAKAWDEGFADAVNGAPMCRNPYRDTASDKSE